MGLIGIKSGLVRASTQISYSTSFSATENPISEGGRWTNGGDTGSDWQNVRTTTGSPNKAYGTGDSPGGSTDNIAILSGFPANQSAQATVFIGSGYTPGSTHEVELLLRFQITANSARGYEVDFSFGGSLVQIIRWDGTIEDFHPLGNTPTDPGGLASGDVLNATMVGNLITVYKNGSSISTVTDNTFADGNPGMGFFMRPGGTLENFCFSQFTATGL